MHSRDSGFTLVEALVAVALLSVLMGLSVMTLGVMPGRARMSGGVLELNAALAAARSQALGHGARAAVLIDTAQGAARPGAQVRYWTVLDPELRLDDAMAAQPGWSHPEDLVLPGGAGAGRSFKVVGEGRFTDSVRLAPAGFWMLVTPAIHPDCVGTAAPAVELLSGASGATRSFPPPFCQVPDEAGCTFCSASGGTVRGAVFFEPDGRVTLVDAQGRADARGAGSLVFSQSRGDAAPHALVLLESGLVRAFDTTR